MNRKNQVTMLRSALRLSARRCQWLKAWAEYQDWLRRNEPRLALDDLERRLGLEGASRFRAQCEAKDLREELQRAWGEAGRNFELRRLEWNRAEALQAQVNELLKEVEQMKRGVQA